MKEAVRVFGRKIEAAVRQRYVDALAQQIRKATGLVPIGETGVRDVFICGYPKSGNTWFQYMTACLVYGADVDLAPDMLFNDLVPDVHFRTYYRRYGETCYFKTHNLPDPAYRRIVYLLRDGRDVMVSYYHHLTAMQGPIDFREMVMTGRGLPSRWQDHVGAYLDNPYGAQMIVIRYEDMKRDCVAQLRRFCEFAGLERSDETLTHVAAQTTFDRMSRKEQKSGWETAGWPKDKPFIRRGAIGSFKDEMPRDVLDAFTREAYQTLAAQGYV
jgi:hypothetical protein